jgi:hypothetical protein
VVTLDASGSSQADGHPLTYLWSQTSGTPVALSDATSAHPTFTAPEVPGSLQFTVTATDTLNPNPAAASSTSAPVQVDVMDYAAPVADAGANQSNVDIGTTVTLDGSGSGQVDGHPVTYAWSQVDGPAVSLSDPTAQKPSFTAPIGPVRLQFQLVVNDSFNSSAPATVYVDVNGIAGLDFSANVSGPVLGEKASSPFKVTVVNNGTLSRTITQASLSASITRNGNPVSPSEYVFTAKSVNLAAHKSAPFTLTWTHGNSALHAGDVFQIQACVNVVGDSTPANNCGTETDPPGPVAVFAWPKSGFAIKATSTNSTLPTWITNISSFAVRPIRVAENVTVTVSVNGGPVQNATPPSMAAFKLDPNLGTNDMAFTWAHPKLTKGDQIVVTACAVIPGNTALPSCWSRTITAS